MADIFIRYEQSGGGGGGAYPEVDTYSLLPSPASVPGEIYVVLNATGTWLLFNRRQSGLYLSNGSSWSLLNSLGSTDIRDLYEQNSDVNRFSDVDKANLDRLVDNEDIMSKYSTNDVDTVSSTTYVGKALPNSATGWLIQKVVDTSGDLTITYANVSNNGSYTTYSTAWAARLSLTYGAIETLTGV